MGTLMWSVAILLVLASSVSGESCENGGTYIAGKCLCPDDFIGTRCEIIKARPGECPSISSTNVNGICECKPGFYGPQCEYTVIAQITTQVPCENGGNYDGFKCICPDKFTGSRCEIVIDRPVITTTTSQTSSFTTPKGTTVATDVLTP
ncbi:anterior pharynx in excess protein 1-like [Leptodactylus fuscus]|uniref:anterior pharynx in excess protein 1-like n=1 Tax=Leptodactylus fuscus TaxID=238119 RepID=UPI003F4F38E9